MTDLRVSDELDMPRAADRRFNELLRQVRAAGLLEPQPRYYAGQALGILLIVVAGAAAFLALGDSWWQLAVAVLFGLCSTHLAFLGHDVSHRQVVRGRAASRRLGLLIGNVLLGFSYGGFVRHHNAHHVNPNHVDRDPDMARRQLLHVPDRDGEAPGPVKAFVARHQPVFFHPLLLAESAALRASTYRTVGQRSPGSAVIEVGLVTLHFAAYLAAVFVVLPPMKAVAFVLVHQVVFGLYTESVVAPNHKAMPVQWPGDDWDWLERQLVTSRNLSPSRVTGFAFGGQNFHIEHHLFPTIARNNARRAQPIVKAYCHTHGLPYNEVSVRASLSELLGRGSVRR